MGTPESRAIPDNKGCSLRTDSRPRRKIDILDLTAWFFLLLFLAAWPWQIFQRLPIAGTLAILAGGILLAAAPFHYRIQRRYHYTGLEGPIGLIALACLQSALHSLDTAASITLLKQYTFYLLLFGAAIPLLRTPHRIIDAWKIFTLSAALTGLLAIACAAGGLAPTLVSTQEYFGRRLSETTGIGAFVRIAATTPDFNQAIFPLIIALPAVTTGLFFITPARRFLNILLTFGLTAALAAGIIISFSRSGLIALALLIIIPIAGIFRKNAADTIKNHRIPIILLTLLLTISGMALLIASGYAQALGHRFFRGIASPDPSYQSRIQVILLAFHLLPRYAAAGCGLGAAPAALAQLTGAATWQGATIHSMPLLFFVETGLLGLIGYTWLWINLFRRLWNTWRTTSGIDQTIAALSLLSAAAAFWLLLVQPFQALSIFPILAALWIAPTRHHPESSENYASPKPSLLRWAPQAALILTLLLAAANLYRYNQQVALAHQAADHLETALTAENRGDNDTALQGYQSAANALDQLNTAPPLRMPSYTDSAMLAADLDFLNMLLPGGLSHPAPRDLALFGAARCRYNQGDFEKALDILSALYKEDTTWPELLYALGEASLKTQNLMAALDKWEEAAHYAAAAPPPSKNTPVNAPPRWADTLQRFQDIADTTDLPPYAKALLLMRLARFQDAEKILENIPDTPETLFWRGLLAEKRQDINTARHLYENLLRQTPAHPEAQARLNRLTTPAP